MKVLLLKKYKYEKNPINIRNPINKNINHLELMLDVNNILKYIIKYIITAPVSGSKKVKIEGISVTINVFTSNTNSFLKDLILLFV